MHTRLLPVARDRLERETPDRANPLPPALAEHPRRLADRVHIAHIQPDQFRQPHSSGIKQLDHRRIPCRHPYWGLLVALLLERRLDEGLDLPGRQKPRQLPLEFRQRDFQ